MRLTLIRTGGIMPITKKAELDAGLSAAEMDELIKHIKRENDDPGQMRDATSFHLKYDAGTFPIDIEKVPAHYKKTFQEMIDNLKIVKQV